MKTFQIKWATPTADVPIYESGSGFDIRETARNFTANVEAESEAKALGRIAAVFPTTQHLTCAEIAPSGVQR